MWWIKASIQEYILKSWSLVKIGTTANQKKLFFNLKKIKRKLTILHARETGSEDYEQIAKELGISLQEVIEIDQRLTQADMSLNQPILGNDQNDELIDFLPENRPSFELTLSHQQEANLKKTLLRNAMSHLNEREIEIIKFRRLSETPKTLDELSKKLIDNYLHRPYVWFLNQNSSNLSKNVLLEVSQVTSQYLIPVMNIFVQTIIIIAIFTQNCIK
jgi:RNA polymerase sigma-32 factor